MTSAQVATLREEASLLLYQMPEEVLAPLIGLMKGITWQAHKTGSAAPAARVEPGFALGGQSGGAHFGSRTVRGAPGIAKGKFVLPDGEDAPKPKRIFGVAAGKFVCPDDIDADNELIADLFEGKQ